MAEDKKDKEVVETAKAEEVNAFKVKSPFTLDKPLIPGNVIYLPKGKLRDTLISNKLIK
jgi:hypothetical protein